MKATYHEFSKLFLICSSTLIFSNILRVKCRKSSRDDHGCLDLLPGNYNRFKPPSNNGKASNIYMQIEVLDLDEINEETMDFRLHAFVRTVWRDFRLMRNCTSIHEGCTDYVWTPDIVFEQAKLISESQHNTYFVEDGDYLYLSHRYNFKVSCMMNFQRYPFDCQRCKFSVGFMYSDDSQAILKWFDDIESPYRGKKEPIDLPQNINPLQFHVMAPKTSSRTKVYLLANFTYLYADFVLVRRLTGSIINYYMPSALLVIMSWITFWLGKDAAAERVALTMTALLTICTQGDQYKDELPPVNYISAMDIWYFVCISMLFATLLEFAFVHSKVIRYRQKLKKKEEINANTDLKPLSLWAKQDTKFTSEDTKDNSDEEMSQENKKNKSKNIDLDTICKFLFPSFFFTFTAIYWSNYTEIVPLW